MFVRRVGFRGEAAVALMVFALCGCGSKQDAAIEHAKQQAASTGQPQTVTSTDKNGSQVTTVVQPPGPGKKVQDEVVTTTVTPKNAVAAAQGMATADAAGTAAAGTQPAPQQPAAAQPAAPQEVDVPAGTELVIRVDQRLSAKGSQPGEKFTGEIVTPVKDSQNNDLIPKGARVTGVVDEAHKRGHFKGAATLQLRLTSLTLNGKEYPLKTHDLSERKKGKGKRTAAFIGGGSGLGMLIGGVATGGTGLLVGGLAGAGAGTAAAGLTGNRDLVIPAESIVHFTLKDDLRIQL
jgi:hypothetical protein